MVLQEDTSKETTEMAFQCHLEKGMNKRNGPTAEIGKCNMPIMPAL